MSGKSGIKIVPVDGPKGVTVAWIMKALAGQDPDAECVIDQGIGREPMPIYGVFAVDGDPRVRIGGGQATMCASPPPQSRPLGTAPCPPPEARPLGTAPLPPPPSMPL